MIAPGRARRPGVDVRLIDEETPDELDSCPFCEGREERTPPETLALPRREPPNSPGWTVRAVPNLYPAFERQEVVVHSPRHVRSLAMLDDREIDLVADAWQRRAAAVSGLYLHALVNEGRGAGASRSHSHSQLVWLAEAPPEVAREAEGSGDGPLCSAPEGNSLDVASVDGVVLRSRWAGRVPYELVVAPVEHERDPWTSERLAPALRCVAEGLRRLHRLEGPVPANAWLHAAEHWHIEIVPRLTVLAGVELGAGIYVNLLAPAEAAERLRRA